MWSWRKKHGDVREVEVDVANVYGTSEDDLDEPRSFEAIYRVVDRLLLRFYIACI